MPKENISKHVWQTTLMGNMVTAPLRESDLKMTQFLGATSSMEASALEVARMLLSSVAAAETETTLPRSLRGAGPMNAWESGVSVGA